MAKVELLQATSFFLMFLFGLFLGLMRPDKREVEKEVKKSKGTNLIEAIEAEKAKPKFTAIKKLAKKVVPKKGKK